MCVYVCGGGVTRFQAHIQRSQDSLQELDSTLEPCGSRTWTQVIMLDCSDTFTLELSLASPFPL